MADLIHDPPQVPQNHRVEDTRSDAAPHLQAKHEGSPGHTCHETGCHACHEVTLVGDHEPPKVSSSHKIEVPASMAHRLTPEQAELLQAHASAHGDSRHQLATVEKLMASGHTFEKALSEAFPSK